MIIGVDPRLSPELLMALAGMGHGDVAVIVDRNFPAGSLGPPVLRLVGCSTPEALEAVVSAIPVDIDDLPSAMLMAEPLGEVEVHTECRAVLRRAGVAMSTSWDSSGTISTITPVPPLSSCRQVSRVLMGTRQFARVSSEPECDVSSSLWSSSHPWGLRPTTRGPESGADPTAAAGPHN